MLQYEQHGSFFLAISSLLFFVSLALMGGVEGYMERIQEFQQQIEANQ